MMFGGLNTKNYCEGCVFHEFVFDQRTLAQSYDESAQKIRSIISKAKDTNNQEGEKEEGISPR